MLTLGTLGLVAAHLLSWGAVCHALLHKRDPRSALGWIVTVLFLPGVGIVLYCLFGISRAESLAARLMRKMAAIEPDYAHHPEVVCHRTAIAPPQEWPLEILGRHLTGQTLCSGNGILPLRNGNEAYPAMLHAINRASKQVFLSTYIFRGGSVGESFTEALCHAARRGVDVRLLVDGFGGAVYSLRKPWKRIPQAGGQLARFLPPRLFPPSLSLNLRNHRKLLICDDTAFTGGMNIADNHILSKHPGCVQDLHFRCEGPIVDQLRRAFLLDWGFATGKFDQRSLLPSSNIMSGDSLCRMVLDGPGTEADPLNDLYCGVIGSAQHTVRIMTPYFLPSHELIAALRSAAQRGVSVRVVLPGKNNLPFVHWASFRLLPVLLEAGVRVWFQPPPFAHTKLLAVDGYYCQIGSANLDARSMRLNFELNMEIFDPEFHTAMALHMDMTIARSREVTLKDLQERLLILKLRDAACWLFSPYL